MSDKIDHSEQKIVIFLAGIFLGTLLGASFKYPVYVDQIEKYETLCQNKEMDMAKVNIAGTIYLVKCKNGVEFKTH
jgi:hypothetical protein